VRVNGTSGSGSGLGLALVAQQGRAHGATVTVGRSPLGGARFMVRFGAAASTAAAEAGPA
jgi:signal transduction histidine kinase